MDTINNIYDQLTDDSRYRHYIEKLIEEQLGEVFPREHKERFLYEMHPGSVPDYLLENLNTHDREFLKKKLTQVFKDINIYNTTHDSISIIVPNDEREDELKRILDFYGYYITRKFDYEGDVEYQIQPVYSKDYTDFIYGDCHGVCYHIVETKNLNSVLKSGLRCKTGNYRYYPERIHVIAAKDPKELNCVLEGVWKELMWDNPGRFTLLRIDLPNTNFSGRIHFYRDDAMYSDHTFFTYTNIPSKYIKKLKTLDNYVKL